MTKSKNKKQEKEIMLDVYFLLDPTQPNIFDQNILDETFHFDFMPYYVGIGLPKNKRYNMHFRPSQLKNNINKEKNKFIIFLKTLSYNLKLFIVKRTVPLELALKIEKEAIKIFGRKDKNTGIMFNITDGGEWQSFPVYSVHLEKQHNEKTILICEKINAGIKTTQKEKVWLYRQRCILRKTQLGVVPNSSKNIIKQMGVPWLFKNKDNEAVQLEYAKQVFDFRDSHNGEIPNKRSKNKLESKLGRWIVAQTSVKNHKGNLGHYYDSIFKLEIEKGYTDTFITKLKGNQRGPYKHSKETITQVWEDLKTMRVFEVAKKRNLPRRFVSYVKHKQHGYGKIIEKYENS